MNIIKINNPMPVFKTYKPGDLFKHEKRKETYMLCRCEHNKYAAICLADGERWANAHEDIESAIKGLEYLSSNVVININ